MLPVKKIYIDTKKKTADSISNSNFKYEIPETVSLPHSTIFYIDDVCIPHSWYTIEEDVNNRIYVQLMDANHTTTSTASKECRIVFIEPGNYNLQQLRAELQTKINAAFAATGNTQPFDITDDVQTNTLKFTTYNTTQVGKILSDADLKTGLAGLMINGVFDASWDMTHFPYDTSNPMDMNDIIKNINGTGTVFGSGGGFPELQTESVDLQPIKNIYI